MFRKKQLRNLNNMYLPLSATEFKLTHSFQMHRFSTPENIRTPYGFLMFSGGRERVH